MKLIKTIEQLQDMSGNSWLECKLETYLRERGKKKILSLFIHYDEISDRFIIRWVHTLGNERQEELTAKQIMKHKVLKLAYLRNKLYGRNS